MLTKITDGWWVDFESIEHFFKSGDDQYTIMWRFKTTTTTCTQEEAKLLEAKLEEFHKGFGM